MAPLACSSITLDGYLQKKVTDNSLRSWVSVLICERLAARYIPRRRKLWSITAQTLPHHKSRTSNTCCHPACLCRASRLPTRYLCSRCSFSHTEKAHSTTTHQHATTMRLSRKRRSKMQYVVRNTEHLEVQEQSVNSSSISKPASAGSA